MRHAYRGMHLDVARFFMPREHVLRLIECMAQLKLNKLHLHLTDDNGWRLEIKRYPRLTEVGAWRVDRPGVPFPARRNPAPGEPTPVGGFYTQDDIREIVAYAAERQIEVIPEIDVPAHSNAALAAYPEYACPVVDRYIGVLPGLGGRNADIIFCAGNERTFGFLQNILDEVLELFPSRYIHLGGDEAWKTHWETCPLCQARIRREKLASVEELQGYFMRRVCDYVRSKGREVIGWDELTNSRLPEGVIIQGWQGYGQAALKAAAQGHRFILTPARVLYLIRYQGPQRFEPVTYFGNNTLQDVYGYEPVQEDWAPEYESLLMGVQASMWTEFCDTPEDVEYLLFPRLAALAEVAWQPRGAKDWPGFLQRLDTFLPRLDAMGVTYARSMFNIQQRIEPDGGALRVELACIRPDVEIRYTTDGSEPAADSPLYAEPLRIEGPVTVKGARTAAGLQQGDGMSGARGRCERLRAGQRPAGQRQIYRLGVVHVGAGQGGLLHDRPRRMRYAAPLHGGLHHQLRHGRTPSRADLRGTFGRQPHLHGGGLPSVHPGGDLPRRDLHRGSDVRPRRTYGPLRAGTPARRRTLSREPRPAGTVRTGLSGRNHHRINN